MAARKFGSRRRKASDFRKHRRNFGRSVHRRRVAGSSRNIEQIAQRGGGSASQALQGLGVRRKAGEPSRMGGIARQDGAASRSVERATRSDGADQRQPAAGRSSRRELEGHGFAPGGLARRVHG